MSINYKGQSLLLTVASQTLATPTSGAKSSNIVHVQVANLDREFRRTLSFWLQKAGTPDVVIAEDVGIEFGTTLQFSGISLSPGESLKGWAETNGLLSITISQGEQR